MNIAVFQVIWNVMLKPLPYADSSRLVQIWLDDGKDERSAPENTLTERWRESSRAFTHLASYRPWRVTIASGGEPEQVFSGLISREFFATMGTPLLAGRGFTQDEMRSGADNVILLREAYWKRRFAGQPAILGKEITVDGMLCRIIGIVPGSFLGTPLVQVARGGIAGRGIKAEPDAYLPISRARVAGTKLPQRTSFVVGRLHGGTSVAQAAQELASIAGPGERRRVWLSPLDKEIGYKLRPALSALIASTGCVLLIACANLANLLLAQAVPRRRELAVRAALGAGRARVVRQLITEAMVLSLAGGVGGLLAAQAISRLIIGLYPDTIPRLTDAGAGWMVYGFALGITAASGLLFGALPAWRATSEATDEALRVGNLWMSRGSRRWAGGMVAVQVGLTAVVLVAAGLLLKSFLLMRDIDIGIAREHVITASVDLPEARYKTREDRARFGAAWLERLHTIPGVSAAGISISLPLRYTTLLDLRLRLPDAPEEQLVGARAVGGNYFQAMGMRWAAGGPPDHNSKGQVAVNEAFVRKHLDGRPAVGVVLPQGKSALTITGVVKDVRHLGLREAARPEVFISFASFPLNPVDTVVRSALPTAQVVAAMRRELRSVDDQIALGRPMAIEEVVDGELARPRFQALLLGLFAAVAMALAALGTYGVIACNVRGRVPELGLRRALGAETPDLVRLVLTDGMKGPLIGLGVGMALGALVVGRFLGTLLYGITPRDPVVFVLTIGILAVTSFLACLLPGALAARVEPSVALRHE